MPENDNDPLAASAQQIESLSDQSPTDAAALMAGQHGHGSQCRSRNRTVICVDPHPSEQDVPYDPLLQFGDQRKEHGTAGSQTINQVGLVRPAESRFVD